MLCMNVIPDLDTYMIKKTGPFIFNYRDNIANESKEFIQTYDFKDQIQDWVELFNGR